MLNPQRIDAALCGRAASGLSRRSFVTTTVGGAVGLALLPGLSHAQAPLPGSKPTEQPLAFITIAPDGTTTILCNRMDMGQGIETGLAMICAEELDADWRKVRTGFGNQQAQYVDPLFGMHLTGGSNSVKNSYQQYRELGARAKAMLVASAAEAWGVPASSLKAENGVISGGGKSAGYGEFFDAAMKHAVPEAVTLKDPQAFKLIGQPTTLTVSQAKATGAQAYGMDVQLPGMAVAVIQRPPVFNGKVGKLDATEALKVKGVKAVLPVPLDRGGQGVAVVASGYWAAKKGREALKVDWDLGGAAKADTQALTKQYLALAKTPGTPAPKPEFQADVSGWSKAPRKITADFVFPYLNHAQMEPLACTVDLKEDRCDLYYAAQMPGIDAANVAKTVGLKPEQVQITVQMAGGGFGRRATPASEWPREAAAVAAALAQAGQRMPVKVIWSREDDMKSGYYRPVHRAEIGFDAAGKVVGWQHRIVSQSILKGSPLEGFGYQKGVDGTMTEGMREPYEIPMNLSVHHPDVNVPVLWWRSVGSTHTAFVMETLVDEIAFATKQDPVAYRLKLMDGNAKAERHRLALQAAVDKSGYGKRKLQAGQAWGVAVHESFESVVAYVVVASLKGKGKDRQAVLQEVHAGVHCNLCVNPRAVETQVQGAAIMALATTMPTHRITLKDGVVEQGNFYDVAMPRMPDAPKVMTVSIVPSGDAPKGMGEPGLPPLAPALANAVARLTGQRQRELPFRFA